MEKAWQLSWTVNKLSQSVNPCLPFCESGAQETKVPIYSRRPSIRGCSSIRGRPSNRGNTGIPRLTLLRGSILWLCRVHQESYRKEMKYQNATTKNRSHWLKQRFSTFFVSGPPQRSAFYSGLPTFFRFFSAKFETSSATPLTTPKKSVAWWLLLQVKIMIENSIGEPVK